VKTTTRSIRSCAKRRPFRSSPSTNPSAFFTDLEPFLAWLDEPLMPDERARGRLFMAAFDGDDARQAAFRARTAR
jgi:hypothetical protein